MWAREFPKRRSIPGRRSRPLRRRATSPRGPGPKNRRPTTPRSASTIGSSRCSRREDKDGPINTDRPTFTPANTVVPPGRLQIESGFTYNRVHSNSTTDSVYDFPELAFRYGLMDRVEFRMFWLGPTFDEAPSRVVRRRRGLGGPSDMEVGFKWQLFAGDKDRKWIPTTALITSVIAPTGGNSPLSSGMAEPYINLIYGWSLTEKLTLAGSTGYLGERQQPSPGFAADNYQRFHQSLVAFPHGRRADDAFLRVVRVHVYKCARQSSHCTTWTGACSTG